MTDVRHMPLRFSHLKHMASSPAHVLSAMTTPFESTLQMRLGTIVHRLVLGGDLVIFNGSRRGEKWEAFKAAHEDEDVFTASELEQAKPMARSLESHSLGMWWLEGVHEQRLEWTFCGRKCRSTPDVYRVKKPNEIGRSKVVDLKTAKCSEPERFGRDARWRRYPEQLAFYGLALGLAETDAHVLVVVESAPPYAVTVIELSDRLVENARKTVRLWMERFLVCEATNDWPAYSQSVVMLDAPDETEPFALEMGDEEISL